MSTVRVTLNGDPAEVEEGITLAGLLDRLGVRRDRVVVEQNRVVLRGEQLTSAVVTAGDELEVVHFVGGG